MGLKICFVSYWGINEGLTQATVLPHVNILAAFDEVEAVDLITIERASFSSLDLGPKTNHIPLHSSKQMVNKVFDRFNFKRIIKLHFRSQKPNLIIARSSLAAWLIQSYAFKNRIPLVVESFEPHAEYMIEAGEWAKTGLKARTLIKAEEQQKAKATFILPLTNRYLNTLVSEGVQRNKLMLMPCCVNLDLFKFDEGDRAEARSTFGISQDKVVGIYTGKIGGIYLEKESIELFLKTRQFFKGNFHLLILSPANEKWRQELIKAGFLQNEFTIDFVSQHRVSKCLSAADFAFSLHRPTPAKQAISPIKNAEFWANGLPIILPDGIGDDSDLTRINRLGELVDDFNNVPDSLFESIGTYLSENRNDNQRVSFAAQYRGFNIVNNCYSQIMGSLIN